MMAERGQEQSRYPHVVRWMAEAPWAIVPSTLALILDAVALRAAGGTLSDEELQARIGTGRSTRGPERRGVVAVIPLYGVITPRADLFSEISGATSVPGFQSALREALGDDEIGAIVLDVDSPGGRVEMIHELAAEIRAARGMKPITAVANTMAGSAAYWIASQADELVATPSAKVGSIGVFAAHDDISVAQEHAGIKTTLISQGKYKTEGNPFEPLSEEARRHIQELVDGAYFDFVSDVAAGRGVSEQAVREGYGQGRLLNARLALEQGMVDRIETLEQSLSRALSGAGGLQAQVSAAGMEMRAGPIAPHSTATSDGPWDGGANKARLANDRPATFRQAFAWFDSAAADPDGDGYPDNKGDYKFIHHEVSQGADVGAANLTACSTGIGVLNGGRQGTTIPSGDREGVYNHLARHLRDAGQEPPPLQQSSEGSFLEQAETARVAVDDLLTRAASLAEVREHDRLTAVKREQLEALHHALGELLADTDPRTRANPLDEIDEIDFVRGAK